jgi:membrane protease YdiL (CAAX protease family)
MTANPIQSDGSDARGVWAWWPLRFIVFFVVLAALYVGGLGLVPFAIKHAPGLPKAAIVVCDVLIVAIVVVAGYRLLVRWMERRDPRELGSARALPLVLGGAAIGFVLFCAVFVALWVLGVASFQGSGTTARLAVAFATSLAAAIGEEVVFRGVVYRLFEEGFGTGAAVLLSGALFGLLHAGNPGATLASSIAIALEAGVLLASAYALARSLWLPIGLHFGWNFTEGGIFGTSVSGGTASGLLKVRLVGPDALTGGQFGPEASLPAVAVCLTAAIVILVLAARRGQWQPLRFRMRA